MGGATANLGGATTSLVGGCYSDNRASSSETVLELPTGTELGKRKHQPKEPKLRKSIEKQNCKELQSNLLFSLF